MNGRYSIIVLSLSALFVCFIISSPGCLQTNTDPGTISDREDSCDAIICHGSTILNKSIPDSGRHTTHLLAGYSCTGCHYDYMGKTTHKNGIYNTSPDSQIVYFYNNPGIVWDREAGTCANISCHGSSGIANWKTPLSNECLGCHIPGSSIDPVTTNGDGTSGKHTLHLNAGIVCENCHNDYKSRNTHKNGIYGKLESVSIVIYGDLFKGNRVSGIYNDNTGRCDAVSCHGYSGNLDWYENNINGLGVNTPIEALINYTHCDKCHGETSVYNPAAIDRRSGNNGSHKAHEGIICARCHNGYTDASTHNNLTLDHEDPSVILVAFDSLNNAGNWISDTGPGTGSCSTLTCHSSVTPDWYNAVPPSFSCKDCHKAAMPGARQVFDSNGNGTGTGGDFNKGSHHVINYANRTTQIIQEDDCLICHDQSHHTSGVVLLKNWDNAGQAVIYDPADPSTLEPFCLGCHDTDGAGGNMSPFSSGNTLGADTGWNEAGSRIESNWDKTYGHRRKGLTCMGDGSPGTGCHGDYLSGKINAHGSDNRGLLGNKYTLPVTSEKWDETNYSLCLDCHDNYPSVPGINEIVGIGNGSNYAQHSQSYNQSPYSVEFMVSRFSDYKSYGYDRQYNLHLYHLKTNNWSYRKNETGFLSCVSCHNVHGTSSRYFFLWDQWNFLIEESGGIQWGRFFTPPGYMAMLKYPGNCTNACHWDSKYRYPRTFQNEAYAVASISTGTLSNGDTVTIHFSNSTNAPVIDESNIDAALQLSGGHSWLDSNNSGSLSAEWSSTNNHTDNVLTITIASNNDSTGDPTLAVNDTIEFSAYNDYILYPYSITDPFGNTVRGKVTLKGNVK